MNSSYVQKAQKKVHYTIDFIGGAKELSQWKALQIAKEYEWQKAQAPFRDKRMADAAAIVRMDAIAPGASILEQAETRYIDSRNDRTAITVTYPMRPTETTPQPRKSLIDHFKSICANVWRNAFDSERQ